MSRTSGTRSPGRSSTCVTIGAPRAGRRRRRRACCPRRRHREDAGPGVEIGRHHARLGDLGRQGERGIRRRVPQVDQREELQLGLADDGQERSPLGDRQRHHEAERDRDVPARPWARRRRPWRGPTACPGGPSARCRGSPRRRPRTRSIRRPRSGCSAGSGGHGRRPQRGARAVDVEHVDRVGVALGHEAVAVHGDPRAPLPRGCETSTSTGPAGTPSGMRVTMPPPPVRASTAAGRPPMRTVGSLPKSRPRRARARRPRRPRRSRRVKRARGGDLLEIAEVADGAHVGRARCDRHVADRDHAGRRPLPHAVAATAAAAKPAAHSGACRERGRGGRGGGGRHGWASPP